MTVNVRRLAADVLYRVLYEDAYSALALNQCIKEHELNPQDAAFLSALVYGVLERKFTLEYIIRQYSSVRIKKIEKKTLIILDLGIYQLLYMDKVPDSAAVNESVKLCKALRLFHSASFVNAVLRSFLRAEKQYGLPDESDRIKYLSICYSCPESIVTLWRDQYGDEMCEKILAAIPGRPPLTVRVNTLKTSDEELISLLTEKGITAEKVPFLPHALNLSRTGSLEKLNEFRKGFFYVEDAASQLCAEVLGVKAGETICDVCAAPGGKSFYSAIRMGNKGVVYSYDLHRHKLNLIDAPQSVTLPTAAPICPLVTACCVMCRVRDSASCAASPKFVTKPTQLLTTYQSCNTVYCVQLQIKSQRIVLSSIPPVR